MPGRTYVNWWCMFKFDLVRFKMVSQWCLNGSTSNEGAFLFTFSPHAFGQYNLSSSLSPKTYFVYIVIRERISKRKIMVLDDHGLTVDFGGMNGKYKCRQCGGFITEGYAFNVHPDVKFHPNCLKCW